MAKPPPDPRSLKQARALMGIPSQRALGQRLGLDKALASSRINRYETGSRGIDLDGLGRLAQAIGVPMAFLVAQDDDTAAIILALSKMSAKQRRQWLKAIEDQG